jgi:fumarate reductase subunit C
LVNLSQGIEAPMTVEKRLDHVADLIENTKVIVVKSITLVDKVIHIETFINFSPANDCKINIELQKIQ